MLPGNLSKIEGAETVSRESRFKPGELIRGGRFNWNIGEADTDIHT